MTKNKSTLSTLLNNETYIKWLRGTCTAADSKAWQQWYKESKEHRQLTERAIKLLNMPFKNSGVNTRDIQQQVKRFEKKFMHLYKKQDTESNQ